MELIDALHQVMQQSYEACIPTDMEMGTVTQEEPLEIQINTSMAPLRAPVLILTEAVVEKKIPVLEHSHSDYYGTTGNALLESNIKCTEYDKELPVEDGYIILNRKLEVGDKVILLKVTHGQRFIVLSRVFEM